MNIEDLITREGPRPWEHGGKLPWNERAFSRRMLREHLSQSHDRASRRSEVIDRHVRWLHGCVLGGRPGRILDLACGPGLYTSRLARLGHVCVGVDFSPASIEHARAEAQGASLPCTYHLGDLRGGDFGERCFEMALLLFGELNTFAPGDAVTILKQAAGALEEGGLLVLEVHTETCVRELGSGEPTWFTTQQGLFSDEPYLCLRECAWDERERVAVERYLVVDARTGHVAPYACSTRAYSAAEYEALLQEAGFDEIQVHPGLTGPATGEEGAGLFVMIGREGLRR